MSEFQSESEFPRQRFLYDQSAGRQKLEEDIARIQRNARCVRRAAALMAVLIVLVVAGVGYPAILLENFFYRTPRFITHLICALGVGSLVSLLFFARLGRAYRKKLNQQKEACRQLVAKLFE
jgi:putative copper export protein